MPRFRPASIAKPFTSLLLGVLILPVVAAAQEAKPVPSAAVAEIVAAAGREGKLKLAWSGTATNDWRREIPGCV